MSGLELPHGPVLFLSLFGSVTPPGRVPLRVRSIALSRQVKSRCVRAVSFCRRGWSGIVLPPGRVGSGLEFAQFGPAAR